MYTHTHTFFSIFFSIMFYQKILNIPVLYSRAFFIHPVCNSLHLLIPNSQSLLPRPLPLGNHKSALYVCKSVSVLQRSSFVSCFIFHI